jgi:pyruvate dehydrogenase E2 component (dihydrolipoamide acetyltransferase)
VAQVELVPVPDIGDFDDVPVVELHVKPGDTVAAEDPLVTLESDKATMDVPAPLAGVIKEVLVSLGDKVSEGAGLVTIDVGAAAAASPPPAEPDPAAPLRAEAEEPAPAEAAEPAPAPAPAPEAAGDAAVYASPSVRRIAREQGIDLSTVTGSGRNGRITVEDVEQAAAGGAPAPAADAGKAAATTSAAAEGTPTGTERVPLTRIQKLASANLSNAWQTIPHVTHHEDADITDLEAFRKTLNAEQSDVKVTMVALLMRACTTTLRAFPRFASSLDGEELIVKHDLHIGFAADTPNGLVVPVIRDVDRKGLLVLAGELTELSGKARAGKLSPKEMSGAVFTISSLGGIGGTGFTPIVNPPQVAILGVVRSAQRPVWDGSAFVPRLILPLSLSYDHRVIDGAAAARFCAHLAGVLSDFRRVLL